MNELPKGFPGPLYWLQWAFLTACIAGALLGFTGDCPFHGLPDANAQEPYAHFKNYDFSGGLNAATSPFILQDNEAEDVDNLRITTEGAVETRGGFRTHSTLGAAERIVSLTRYSPGNGTAEWVAHLADAGLGAISYYDGSGWARLFESTAEIHFAERTSFVNFLGDLYLTNVADGLRWYDGSTTGEVEGEPPCRFIAVHGQRLYMAGNASEPYTFYFSGLRDGTVWDDVSLAGVNAGYWILPSKAGGAITGFANWQGFLLIFTENSIYALQGDYPDESSLTEIVPGIGCSAPDSIVNVGGEVFFKHSDKVYRMGTPPVCVSKKLEGLITVSDAAQAVGWDRNYVIINPAGSHDTEIEADVDVLLYDIDRDRWTKWNNIPWHAAAVSAAAQDDEAFMVARSNVGDCALYSKAHFADSWGAYTARWKSRIFHFDMPELNKKMRHVQFDARGSAGNMTFSYDCDYGRVSGQQVMVLSVTGTPLGSFVMGSSTLGGGTSNLFKFPFPNRVMAKAFQFTLTATPSSAMIIYGYALRYRAKPFRGSAY